MIGTASQIITRMLPIVKTDPDKLYEVKEHKERRSLQANAYFHRLVGLLAHGSGEKFYRVKNECIANYGNHELIRGEDGKPVYEILPDDDRWRSDMTEHYVPTSYTDDFRGVKTRAFLKLKGTHTYSSKEVAQASGLSEGAISGYFSNRGITTKNGLNLSQILEVLTARRRNNGALSTEKVRALVKILQAAGIDTPFVYQEEK